MGQSWSFAGVGRFESSQSRVGRLLAHVVTPMLSLLQYHDTSKSTGRSGRQKAATRRNMRREERVTVQGPVKEQQPDGMSHREGGLARTDADTTRARRGAQKCLTN